MEQELISKKDLLVKYGISYGALYRWKRMGLIPEDWFLKKSAVTGQETFFPKRLICERVELILGKKEVSLEELAEELCGKEQKEAVLVLSTVYGEKQLKVSEILGIKLVWGDKEKDLAELMKEDF
ncbi:MAG: DUF4004 family protein [Clostridia bacterium]|nr:DUF4004 family protein [Clostridia bacterium]